MLSILWMLLTLGGSSQSPRGEREFEGGLARVRELGERMVERARAEDFDAVCEGLMELQRARPHAAEAACWTLAAQLEATGRERPSRVRYAANQTLEELGLRRVSPPEQMPACLREVPEALLIDELLGRLVEDKPRMSSFLETAVLQWYGPEHPRILELLETPGERYVTVVNLLDRVARAPDPERLWTDLLVSRDPRIQERLAFRLSLDAPRSREVLLEACSFPETAVRRRALEGLLSLTTRGEPARRVEHADWLATRGLEALVAAASDDERSVRALAQRLFYELSFEQRVVAVRDGADTLRFPVAVRAEVRRHVELLRSGTRDPDPAVAFWARHALVNVERGRWLRLEELARQEPLRAHLFLDRVRHADRGELMQSVLHPAPRKPDLGGAKQDPAWLATVALSAWHLRDLVREGELEVLEAMEGQLDERIVWALQKAEYREASCYGALEGRPSPWKPAIDRPCSWFGRTQAELLALLDDGEHRVHKKVCFRLQSAGVPAEAIAESVQRNWRRRFSGRGALTESLASDLPERGLARLAEGLADPSPDVRAMSAWTLALAQERGLPWRDEIARLVDDPVDLVGLTAISALAVLDQ